MSPLRLTATTRTRRVVLAAAVALLLAFAPVPASAHNSLISATPGAGTTLDRVPPEVVLTFDEPAISLGTQVVVTGPQGPVQAGPPRLAGGTVTQSLQPGSPAGDYTVDYRVTSADGHPVSGRYRFTAAAAAAGTPTTPAPAEPGPRPTRPFGWALALVGIAAAVLALLRGGRRRARSAPSSPPDFEGHHP